MADVKEDKEVWKELRDVERRLSDKIEELRKELHQETKSLREELHRLDKKFTILILIVIFLIVFLNQSALEFFFRVLGLLK